MEKNNKKKYYQNNKKYYYHKKNNKQTKVSDNKITYEKLVNVQERENDAYKTYSDDDSNDLIIKCVLVSVIVLAIIFGSLLLFHLI